MKKTKYGIDVVTYTPLVHKFGCVGKIKRARKVFDEMIKEGLVPSIVTYNAWI